MTVIALAFTTGRTLTLTAREPDGTLRGTAAQAMSEDEAEHYVVDTDVDLETGDIVKIRDSVWGPVMSGEYKPEFNTAEIEAELQSLATEAGKQFTEETVEPEPDTRPRIVNI